MAALPIIYYPDEGLRKKCKRVKTVDPQVMKLIHDLAETMYANRGVGLAASQVGVNRRVIVVHAHQDEEQGTSPLIGLVNPEIIEKSEEQEIAEEGCLSIPGVRGDVVRSLQIIVEGLDVNGEPIRLETNGLEARILQHEIDHLDGVLFVDYMDGLTREAVLKEYLEQKEGTDNETT